MQPVADALLTVTLLPAADALDQANREALDAGYIRARGSGSWGMIRLLLGGMMAIGVLLGTQVFLARRTHRLVNPALAAATAIVLAVLVALGSAYSSAGGQLRRAKEDCFESIHVLEQARADGYETLAAERLALLDSARAGVYARRFQDSRDRIVTPPPGTTIDGLTAAVVAQKLPNGSGLGGDQEAVPRVWGALARSDLPEAVKGYITTELRNITFVGEREEAVDTLRNFAEFVAADSRLNGLANAGRGDEAVDMVLSGEPGGPVRAFQRFEAAIGRTLEINHREFRLALDRGFASWAPFGVTTPVAALVAALLATVGLWPRLKEYAP